jgi:hypothetical protein
LPVLDNQDHKNLTAGDSIVYPVNYEHLFKEHLLKPSHRGAVFNSSENHYWPSIVLFVAITLLVLLKVTSPVRTYRVLNAAYSLQVARQVEREDYSPFKRVPLILTFIFILTAAFLFYKLNAQFGSILLSKEGIVQYLFFVLAVALAVFIKFVVNSFISLITGASHLFKEYINNTFIINQAMGVVLLPVIIIAELSPLNPGWLILPALLFLCFGYVLRLYRGFVFAALEEGVGFLQLFVYLCALEILPLLVLVKFLVVNF